MQSIYHFIDQFRLVFVLLNAAPQVSECGVKTALG